jgi:hypothetical protein
MCGASTEAALTFLKNLEEMSQPTPARHS